MEVDLQGGNFTWKGPEMEGYNRLFEKLDRVLCFCDWRVRFVDAGGKILLRAFSNHHPILITLNISIVMGEERTFRFENIWLTHEDFPNFLANEWNNGGKLINNLQYFTRVVKEWNVNVLGNFKKRKRKILARLRGI